MKHSFLSRYSHILENEIKRYGESQGWDMSAISSHVAGEEIKLSFGRKRYLKYVDKGTQPFLMYALEGKIIPIGDSFRYVTDVGLPGQTYFVHNGIPVRRWRDQKWRHPGIKPRHFVKDAQNVAESILENEGRLITRQAMPVTALQAFLEVARLR